MRGFMLKVIFLVGWMGVKAGALDIITGRDNFVLPVSPVAPLLFQSQSHQANEIGSLPDSFPSSSLFEVIGFIPPEEIEKPIVENEPKIWPAGWLFNPKYQGVIFASIDIPSQYEGVENLDELLQNIKDKEVEINGTKYELNPELVSLFNLGYYNLKFYKGIYINLSENLEVAIFPHLKEDKLLVTLTASDRNRENVEGALREGIHPVRDLISSLFSEREKEEFSVEKLREVVSEYYNNVWKLWDEISEVEHNEASLLVSDKVEEVVEEIETETSLISVLLKEIVQNYSPQVRFVFDKFNKYARSKFQFNTSQDFSNLQKIEFEFILKDTIIQNLRHFKFILIDMNGKEAKVQINKEELKIDELGGEKSRVYVEEPIAAENFQREKGFDMTNVGKLAIGIKVSNLVAGELEISKFNFLIEQKAELQKYIERFRYKNEVVEPFMRFYLSFNPLTRRSDDNYLDEMVLPAVEGKESYLEMYSRVWWHIENVVFLSKKLGAIQHIEHPDMARIKFFEELLIANDAGWQKNLYAHDEVGRIRENIWRRYGNQIRSTW